MTVEATTPPEGLLPVLHELLVALLGHTGEVFVEDVISRPRKDAIPPPTSCCFRLSEDLTWICGPDRTMLNQVVRLGYHVHALERFLEQVEHQKLPGSTSPYWHAMASGITEVLDMYRAAILRVQQQLLADSRPVLSAIPHFLSSFQVLLPALHELVAQVVEQPLRGSALLTRLWELSKSGLPEVETVAARLLWHCNNVLFRQISSWVVYGMLEDPCEEFFLQPQQARAGELPEAQEADGSEAAMGAAAAVHVRLASLPPYVSLKMAESIGFMGTSVRLLSRPQGRLAARQVLLQQDMQGVAEALHALQQRPVFSCLAFERTIEQLRTQVASLLWRVLDRDAHLQDHLQLIKDFFLLGRGDFFHTFLTEGAELLALPPREATASKDINTPFQQSAVMSDAHHIPLFDLLSIELSPPTSAKDEQAALPPIQLPEFSGRRDGAAGQQLSWDDISLQYQVEWPLGMLLTPRCMHLYRCMFQYLLRLKQCEIALHQLWTGPLLAQALTLQGHMRHLINNLHKYIQLDVLEPNFSALQAVMRRATDFEEVRRSHDAWLDAIVTQSLLLQPNLCRLLGRIFRSCRHLQQLVQPRSGLRAAASAQGMPLAEKVALISKDFDTHSYQLYLLLSSTKLQGSDNAPRLQQLYLRLDFNGYVRQSLLKRLAVKGSSVAR